MLLPTPNKKGNTELFRNQLEKHTDNSDESDRFIILEAIDDVLQSVRNWTY